MNYTIVNTTPHTIKLNDGTTFEPSGIVARVATTQKDSHKVFPFPHKVMVNNFDNVLFTDSEGNTIVVPFIDGNGNPIFYIVSAMVLDAISNSMSFYFLAPNTSSPEVIRNEKGHIVSVPNFVTN
jgi:hypothetical protein